MATKVPISVENIAFERLNLSRHYLTIDCDFTCFLVLNPSGSVPSEGTDICVLHVGAWQIDAWTLLTKKDFPNQAGFSACLVWDKTLVGDGANRPSVVESDIDVSNSISTLKGQPVNITGFSMAQGQSLPVTLFYDTEKVTVDNALPVCECSRFINFIVGSVPVRFDLMERLVYRHNDDETHFGFTFYPESIRIEFEGGSFWGGLEYCVHTVGGVSKWYHRANFYRLLVRLSKATGVVDEMSFLSGGVEYTGSSAIASSVGFNISPQTCSIRF